MNQHMQTRSEGIARARGMIAGLLGGAVALWATIAAAQTPVEPYIPKEAILERQASPAPAAVEIKAPWTYLLRLGANAAVSSSTNVIGQTNGLASTLGGQLTGAANYRKGVHQWRNNLRLSEAFTLTPTVPEFVKSNDTLAIESIYLYHIPQIPWFGPFGRFQYDTALLPGHDVRAGDVTWEIYDASGALDQVRTNQPGNDISRLKLSDSFMPSTLREAVGVFAAPYDEESFKLEFKVAMGGRQVFAEGQRAVNDDDATPVIEVQTLRNVFQAGPMAGVEVRGVLMEERFGYYGIFEVMSPLINNQLATDTRSVGKLTNLLFEAGFSVKVVRWASLDYTLKILREPQVFDATQILNNLLLTFSYTFLDG